MRLCRTNLVAVLTIVVGMAIGASLSLIAPSATAVCTGIGAADPLHERVACAEARYLAARENDDWLEEAQRRLERDRLVWRRENPASPGILMISPDGQWIMRGDSVGRMQQPIPYVIF